MSGARLLQAEYWSSALTLFSRLTLAGVLWVGGSAFAADARIAVAANFRDTAKAIAARLEAESPHRYEVIAGSTGKLASQILSGAPFDVFMAADRERPQLLVDRGLASAATQQIYAVGELGLWWPSGAGTPTLKALATLEPRLVCMANPAFAPYGEAAWAMLQSAGLEARWLAGVVRVDNVNLVAGLIARGDARAGFVARSSLIAGERRGTVVAADEEVLWFAEGAPVDQAMVLLTRAEKNVAARHWVEQMQAAPIRELIQRDGYRLVDGQGLMSGDLQAVWLTAFLAATTTLLLVPLASPLAWWLARSTSSSRSVIEAVVAMPLVLPPTVLGFYLLIMLNPESAFGSLWVELTGDSLTFSFSGLVIASIIYSLPFMVQPLQAGFRAVPESVLEAAATLGASPLDRWLNVVLPMVKRGYLTGCVLTFAHTVGEFGVVLMMGGNIPGETRVLSIAIYEHVETLNYDAAHLLALGLLGFSFLSLWLVYRFAGHRFEVVRG